MPLAFDSMTHGTLAFGFFNIDSDMLLLDRYFMFATDFCAHISQMARAGGGEGYEASWQIYKIEDPQDVGDLMGAIHGVRHTGFIGEVYRRFPFPDDPGKFRQKPEGEGNRGIVESIIAGYAEQGSIPVRIEQGEGAILVGAYGFTRAVFHQLLNYVWVGGYPRWRDGVRPGCVISMKGHIQENEEGIFEGILFEE